MRPQTLTTPDEAHNRIHIPLLKIFIVDVLRKDVMQLFYVSLNELHLAFRNGIEKGAQ
jgi:hypothetical protein